MLDIYAWFAPAPYTSASCHWAKNLLSSYDAILTWWMWFFSLSETIHSRSVYCYFADCRQTHHTGWAQWSPGKLRLWVGSFSNLLRIVVMVHWTVDIFSVFLILLNTEIGVKNFCVLCDANYQALVILGIAVIVPFGVLKLLLVVEKMRSRFTAKQWML